MGSQTTVESLQIIMLNSNSRIIIGNDCMFAYGITLFNTDAHPIYDLHTNQIINKVRMLSIGNHCWIGANAIILKNVNLPDNTIVGRGAVVTKSFDKEHIAIAGNPARIVKENVRWERYDNAYIDNEL